MRPALTVLCLMLGMAVRADSYLYWMIGDTTGYKGYDTVRIKAVDSTSGTSTYLMLGWNDQGNFTAFSPSGSLVASDSYLQEKRANAIGFYASLAGLAGVDYGYVVELLCADAIIAESGTLSSAASLQYIVDSNEELKSLMTAWNPAGYAAPEPSSALLTAVGISLLALRRRRDC